VRSAEAASKHTEETMEGMWNEWFTGSKREKSTYETRIDASYEAIGTKTRVEGTVFGQLTLEGISREGQKRGGGR